MTNLNNTFRYRIYDLLGQIKPKRFYVSAMIVALILTTLGANAQPKQAPTADPKPITNKVPVEMKPEPFRQGNNLYKAYKNADGQIFRVEKYTLDGAYEETRYIEEVYPNGKPAKEIIVTGGKDKNGLDTDVTKHQEVYFDAKGNKIKTETYTDFTDGVANNKVVTENGRTTTYGRVNGQWKVVPYPPSSSGRPTTPLGGSSTVSLKPENRGAVSGADARRMIQGYLGEIEARQKYMAENYYWAGAEKTVLKAFKENGIDSPGNAHTWSGAMGLTWSQMAKRYYESHWNEFNSTLKLIAEKRCVAGTDVDLLDAGFKKWEAGDKEIEGEFRKIINTYVLESKNLQARDDYLKIYNAKYDSLSAQRPYPGGQIKVINDAKNIVVGKSETEYKAIEANEDVIAKRITEISTTLVFKAITNMQPCGPVR